MNIDPNLFINNNYGLMRHGKDLANGEITKASAKHCRESIVSLIEKIGQDKKFIIFHSPINRAVNTAKIVTSELLTLSVEVEKIGMLTWLIFDNYFTNEDVATLPLATGTFTLLISHEPNIEGYLNQFHGVGNCVIFSRDFIIW